MDKTMSVGKLGGALGWLGVGAYGIWVVSTEGTSDTWEQPYLLFSIALLLATASTLVLGWAISRSTARNGARRVGIGFGALAVVSSLVAWALPLWMALVALSAASFAVASGRPVRSGLAGMAAGQVIGMVALFAAIEAEIGPRDSFGDYPVAFGISLVVAGLISALAVAAAGRAARDTRHDDSERTVTVPASR